MNRVCAQTISEIDLWAKANSNDAYYPYRALLRETKRLEHLRPPPGERQAFAAFVSTTHQGADVTRELIQAPPEELRRVHKGGKRVAIRGSELARRLGAITCAAQARGSAH